MDLNKLKKSSVKLQQVLVSVILFLFPSCSSIPSDIKEINSIQEVKDVFKQATQDDLFVFDVDQTILEPAEPVMQAWFCDNPKLGKINADFFAFLKTKNNAVEYEDLFDSKALFKTEIEPVEQALIDAILTLQKRSIKVIALTALETGKLGIINRREVWRYNQLLKLGLDFSRSFEPQEITFCDLQNSEFAAKYKDRKGKDPSPALFYRGIACSSTFPKGVILKILLEKLSWKPARVYFFDDRRKHVESVVRGMKEAGIECHAFVYNAAIANRPASGTDIKEVAEVAMLQYELMKQRDDAEYISYSEAKRIMEHQHHIKVAQPARQIAQQPVRQIKELNANT